jgi:catechol 2,3-dioxygenase-like lactoylglutathione lyase family enzyme
MGQISVRYIVEDVAAAVDFYSGKLGFEIDMQPAPGFAALRKDGVRLFLNQPGAGGAGQNSAGDTPSSGGWNRIQIEVENLAQTAKDLKHSGCAFKGEIVLGRGGKQLLLLDPSGNLVELFEPSQQA